MAATPTGHAARIAEAIAYAQEQRKIRLQAAQLPPARAPSSKRPTARLKPLKHQAETSAAATIKASAVAANKTSAAATNKAVGSLAELGAKDAAPHKPRRSIQQLKSQHAPLAASTELEQRLPPELEQQFRAEYRAAHGEFGPLAQLMHQANRREAEREEAAREAHRLAAQACVIWTPTRVPC